MPSATTTYTTTTCPTTTTRPTTTFPTTPSCQVLCALRAARSRRRVILLGCLVVALRLGLALGLVVVYVNVVRTNRRASWGCA